MRTMPTWWLTAAPAAVVAVQTSSNSTSPEAAWHGNDMKMTHYWDCNGQGCDAATLQPWDETRYISPVTYGPQDPNDHGGALHGERIWLTGAASDAMSQLMGDDDGCCGADPNDGGVGGCGKCLLVQNPDSLEPDWTAVVMKKSRCPPHSHGCGSGQPHFDLAVPGFDNLQYSTANVCGERPGTGFESKGHSELLGKWYEQCQNTKECIHLCGQLPESMRKGCELFASWGWNVGNPSSVKFRPVECPAGFVRHVGSVFGASGPTQSAAPSVVIDAPEPAPTPAAPSPAPSLVPAPAAPGGGGCLSEWQQCDGHDWTGPGGCCEGLTCVKDNEWHSMCKSAAALVEERSQRVGHQHQTVRRHRFRGADPKLGAVLLQSASELSRINPWQPSVEDMAAVGDLSDPNFIGDDEL